MASILNMKSMSSPGRPILVLVGVIALFWAGRHFDLQDEVLASIESLGAWGILIFGLTYVVATVAFVPGLILTLGAGFLCGVLEGTAIVSAASTLGAGASFLIRRHLARDWVAQKIEGNVKFRRIAEAVGKEGWRIVGLVRLSPIFPYNLLNSQEEDLLMVCRTAEPGLRTMSQFRCLWEDPNHPHFVSENQQ